MIQTDRVERLRFQIKDQRVKRAKKIWKLHVLWMVSGIPCPSRLSNDLTDKNRTPLQDISLTVNMNRERENENSIQDENVIGSKHNRLSSIQTPKQLFGVFQSSLVTPLSVLTEGPSRLSNDLIDKTRAPLQDIPATLNMNRERDSSFQSTSSTITNAMRSSTMEFRNLNNDFEEAMEEQDLTNNESIDSSFKSTSSTITNAMRSSTMEFRNLNNDFEEAMEEQDLTNNESIG
nr:hypothetical protein Iba_chr05dCG11060 [Ipomoea batatas]